MTSMTSAFSTMSSMQ